MVAETFAIGILKLNQFFPFLDPSKRLSSSLLTQQYSARNISPFWNRVYISAPYVSTGFISVLKMLGFEICLIFLFRRCFWMPWGVLFTIVVHLFISLLIYSVNKFCDLFEVIVISIEFLDIVRISLSVHVFQVAIFCLHNFPIILAVPAVTVNIKDGHRT